MGGDALSQRITAAQVSRQYRDYKASPLVDDDDRRIDRFTLHMGSDQADHEPDRGDADQWTAAAEERPHLLRDGGFVDLNPLGRVLSCHGLCRRENPDRAVESSSNPPRQWQAMASEDQDTGICALPMHIQALYSACFCSLSQGEKGSRGCGAFSPAATRNSPRAGHAALSGP